MGVHPLFGQDYPLTEVCESAILTLFSQPPLTAWRGRERQVLGVTFFIILDFPSILAQSRLVHPLGSVRGNEFAHQITRLSQEFHAPSEEQEGCTESEL